MTYIVPNFFEQENYDSLMEFENFKTLCYINKVKDSKIFARSTMHYMVVLLEGSKHLQYDGRQMEVKSGEICFLTQGNYFMSERLADKGTYKTFLIFFDDRFVSEFVQKFQIGLDEGEIDPIIKVPFKQDVHFSQEIKLLEEYLNQKADSRLIRVKIEEILLLSFLQNQKLFKSYLRSTIKNSHDRVAYILESNIDIIDSVEDMCSLTSLTNQSLRSYTKRHFDKTPREWLITQKLDLAKTLLKNSDKSIQEIATSCGYSSVSWFIEQFKSRFGKTPREFREDFLV